MTEAARDDFGAQYTVLNYDCPYCRQPLKLLDEPEYAQCPECDSPFTVFRGELAMLAAPAWVKEELLDD